jgi:hypothetical protein
MAGEHNRMDPDENYKLLPKTEGHTQQMILRMSDNAHIPDDPDNTDYQIYLEWLAAGNIPQSPDLEIHPDMKTEE